MTTLVEEQAMTLGPTRRLPPAIPALALALWAPIVLLLWFIFG